MNMEYENDSKRFNESYEGIATSIDKLSVAESQKNRIKDLFFEEVQALHIKKFGVDSETLIRRIKEEEQKEQNRVNYAKSFNEFYEYDVVTIINKDHGIVDKDKMRKSLMEYARNGWKLHTMYSNELGKNAIRILGFEANSTACEDVLIFERRIETLE